MSEIHSPAEAASQRALESMYACLSEGRSFRLEAGAGAGKTYSLIKALRFLRIYLKNVASKLPASPLLTWRRMKSSREQIEAPSFFVIPILVWSRDYNTSTVVGVVY